MMSDYKELIDALNATELVEDLRYFFENKFDCDYKCLIAAVGEAADTIEQLLKERDATIADLTELSNSHQSCKYCKNLKDDICTHYANHPKQKEDCGDGKFFEWRGVQEVKHG